MIGLLSVSSLSGFKVDSVDSLPISGRSAPSQWVSGTSCLIGNFTGANFRWVSRHEKICRIVLSGESLFLRKIFPGILLEKSEKITRPLMPSAAPIRPASPVSTQQGAETSLRNDLTSFRKACIFTTLTLRENTCPTAIAD